MTPPELKVAVIGAGPAGLMAAEVLAAAGVQVTVYDRMATAGRKFLMAGRGGLNLTHSEDLPAFLGRYGAATPRLRAAIEAFPPAALRAWCEGLGQETFVGTSGRVVNEVTVEGTDAEASDERIEEMLDKAFKEDDQWDRDKLDLTFDSKAGVVTITGDAPSEAVKDRVTARVKQVPGVKDVVNNLEVKK